jgi:hypothetical protein
MPFPDLQNTVIGVEATAYLQNMIDEPPTQEPLLAALGGDPIALKYYIETELDNWKQNGITPLFVFEGQSTVGKDEIALRTAKAALMKTGKAWRLYVDNHPDEAVKGFGSSGEIFWNADKS